jgi:cytosine/adenosine deaminase-related metal-dependent hydrolase
MFSEMRSFVRKTQARPPAPILRMATLNGAQALGLAGRIGEISAGRVR